GLLHRIGVDAGADTNASRPPAAGSRRCLRTDDPCAERWRRVRSSRCRRAWLELVGDAFGAGAAVTFQLCPDPVDGGAVAIRALAPIAERCQPFDGGLVAFEIEARY